MLLACPVCDARFRVSPEKIKEGREVRCSKCANLWFALPDSLIAEEGETARPKVKPSSAFDRAPPSIRQALSDVPRPSAKRAAEEAALSEFQASAPSFKDPSAASVHEPPVFIDEIPRARIAYRPVAAPPPRAVWPLALAVTLLLLANLAAGIWTFRSRILDRFPVAAPFYQALGIADTRGLELGDLALKATGEGDARAYDLSGVLYNASGHVMPHPVIDILMMKDHTTLREWKFAEPGTIAAGENFPFKNDEANKLTGYEADQATAFRIRVGSPGELSLRD